MTGTRGSGVAEALFAGLLGALAAGLLASAALTGARALALARGAGAEAAAIHDGLERLRGQAAGAHDETIGALPAITRHCERSAGRGRPDPLVVTGSWSAAGAVHGFGVRSRHLP